jgi:hypothetical protein
MDGIVCFCMANDDNFSINQAHCIEALLAIIGSVVFKCHGCAQKNLLCIAKMIAMFFEGNYSVYTYSGLYISKTPYVDFSIF